MKPEYRRVLLKLSGEGLAGADKTGINENVLEKLCAEISKICKKGVQICLVIGGGNFFRGAKNAVSGMDRSEADQVGMLATVMNAVALRSALRSHGCKAVVFSGLAVPSVCETYSFRKAMTALENGETVIFAGGTGSPYFTTDTGAVLRAVEMHCDILLKATQVDGVYDSDPRFNTQAKRYESVSFSEVLEKHLNVMDMTAIAMARDNNLPVMIFAQAEEDALYKAVCGKAKCTIIKS